MYHNRIEEQYAREDAVREFVRNDGLLDFDALAKARNADRQRWKTDKLRQLEQRQREERDDTDDIAPLNIAQSDSEDEVVKPPAAASSSITSNSNVKTKRARTDPASKTPKPPELVDDKETEKFFATLGRHVAQRRYPTTMVTSENFPDGQVPSQAYLPHPETGMGVPASVITREERQAEDERLAQEVREAEERRIGRGRPRGNPLGREYTDDEKRQRHKACDEPKPFGRQPNVSNEESPEDRNRRIHRALSTSTHADPLLGDDYVPQPLSTPPNIAERFQKMLHDGPPNIRSVFPIGYTSGIKTSSRDFAAETLHPHALLQSRTPVSYTSWYQAFVEKHSAHLRPFKEMTDEIDKRIHTHFMLPDVRVFVEGAPGWHKAIHYHSSYGPLVDLTRYGLRRSLLTLSAAKTAAESNHLIYDSHPFLGTDDNETSSKHVPRGVFYPVCDQPLRPDLCISQSLAALKRHGTYLRVATTTFGDHAQGDELRFVHGSLDDIAEFYQHAGSYERFCDPVSGVQCNMRTDGDEQDEEDEANDEEKQPDLYVISDKIVGHKLWFQTLGDDHDTWRRDERASEFVTSILLRLSATPLPRVIDTQSKNLRGLPWKNGLVPMGIFEEEAAVFAQTFTERLSVYTAQAVAKLLCVRFQFSFPTDHRDYTQGRADAVRDQFFQVLYDYICTRYYRLRRFRGLVSAFGEYLFGAGLHNTVYRPLQIPIDIVRRSFDVTEHRARVELHHSMSLVWNSMDYLRAAKEKAERGRMFTNCRSQRFEPNPIFYDRALRFLWMDSLVPKGDENLVKFLRSDSPEHSKPSKQLQQMLVKALRVPEQIYLQSSDTNRAREIECAIQAYYRFGEEFTVSPREMNVQDHQPACSVRVLFALVYLRALDSVLVTRNPSQKKHASPERVLEWLPECIVHDSRFGSKLPLPEIDWSTERRVDTKLKPARVTGYEAIRNSHEIDRRSLWSFVALKPSQYFTMYRFAAQINFGVDQPIRLSLWTRHADLVRDFRSDQPLLTDLLNHIDYVILDYFRPLRETDAPGLQLFSVKEAMLLALEHIRQEGQHSELPAITKKSFDRNLLPALQHRFFYGKQQAPCLHLESPWGFLPELAGRNQQRSLKDVTKWFQYDTKRKRHADLE